MSKDTETQRDEDSTASPLERAIRLEIQRQEREILREGGFTVADPTPSAGTT